MEDSFLFAGLKFDRKRFANDINRFKPCKLEDEEKKIEELVTVDLPKEVIKTNKKSDQQVKLKKVLRKRKRNEKSSIIETVDSFSVFKGAKSKSKADKKLDNSSLDQLKKEERRQIEQNLGIRKKYGIHVSNSNLPAPLQHFVELGSRYGCKPYLLRNFAELGYKEHLHPQHIPHTFRKSMCNPKMKSEEVAKIDGRPVLQPACNRIPTVHSNKPIKKTLQRSLSSPISVPIPKITTTEAKKVVSPPYSPNKSKKSTTNASLFEKSRSFKNYSSYEGCLIEKAPGSIAAKQREIASLMQARRKMKFAHYGRTPEKLEKVLAQTEVHIPSIEEEKRCSFITQYSDPLYVAYHDEEWGVPVHDDKMLFELLVLSGAQVGLDWETILRRRNDFRSAFVGFDAEIVAKFTARKIASICSEYKLDIGKVRGIVDNSNRILEVIKDFGSFNKYIWGFVNHKPISTNYKFTRKIPVKTSKSETISKDMVRRGFRFVGPTVIHSFMQAAGLTNDHLISCPRHCYCSSLL